jgi:hypothetical protein
MAARSSGTGGPTRSGPRADNGTPHRADPPPATHPYAEVEKGNRPRRAPSWRPRPSVSAVTGARGGLR